MTQSLIRARYERRFGKGRHRKRHLKSGDQAWLDMIDKMLTMLDEAEHDLRAMTRNDPPHILADYLAGADEARREFEDQRRWLLTNPFR